jgi:hypothetical protein
MSWDRPERLPFYELLLILALSGEAVPAGRASIGDRVIINNVNMTPDGKIVVDMMDHAPGEGLCCASLRVQNTYEVQLGRATGAPAP